MLVLSRRVEEKLIVGDAVLTIVRIHGNRVDIGIEAPQEVRVVRAEVDQEPKDKGE